MKTCDTYQAYLLDHLYGLLDDAERADLAAHLEGCDACRAALAAAEGQRGLLAVAAKSAFPGVRFEPPAVPAAEERPPSIKLVQPQKGRRPWRAWGAAAAVFLAAAGVTGVGGYSWHQHHQELALAQAKLDEAARARDAVSNSRKAELTRSEQNVREVQDEIMKVEASWKKDLTRKQQEAADKQIGVIVSGPSTVEAGARNDYHIQIRKAVPGPAGDAAPAAPARVTARVVNPATRQVYYQQALVTGKGGDCVLALPPDLPVKPNTQLALEVTARVEGGAEAKVTEQLPILGTLYLTHLATDRPMYRPGEVVHFRSLTLERYSLKPAREDFGLVYTISDPAGAPIFQLAGKALLTQGKGQAVLRGPDGKKALRGIGAGEFTIPPTAPGGEYTLTVADVQGRFPAERRRFLVNQYQAPRLNKELEFTRKSYGPGAVVEASCKVSRVQGGTPLVNRPVLVTANVDGKKVAEQKLRTDKAGKVPTIRFTLPAQMERGRGSLSVQLTDGANHETIVRSIPIVLKKLFVDFYPEGGDLVAGVPNRVYFQARTTLNKPAEVRGRVVDGSGTLVASAQTLSDDTELGVNQGMGRFQLTPEAGKSYELKIDAPLGIEGRYALPKVRPDGVVLSVPRGVVTDKIDVTLYTGKTQHRLLVGAYCRGRVLQTRPGVVVKPGAPAHVTLTPAEEAGGVYRITVFDERGAAQHPQLVPVAERLIYRRPARRLDLAFKTDKKSYGPGDPVSVTWTAKDEKAKLVPAVLLVSVVDQGLIKLADEKTARSMPAHFLLTTEIKKPEDLEYADFLLSDHPKAETALDLLLGTQGWRRFAEQDPAQFRQKEKQDAERLLLASGLSAPATHDSLLAAQSRVDEQYAPLHKQKEAVLAEREAEDEQTKQQARKGLERVSGAVAVARREAREAETTYRENNEWLTRTGLAGLACLLLLVGVCGVVTGLVKHVREEGHARPYVLSGVCSLALLFVVGSAWLLSDLGNGRQSFSPREAQVAMRQEGRAPAPKMGRPKLGDFGQVDWDKADGREVAAGGAKGGEAKLEEKGPKLEAPAPPPGRDMRPGAENEGGRFDLAKAGGKDAQAKDFADRLLADKAEQAAKANFERPVDDGLVQQAQLKKQIQAGQGGRGLNKGATATTGTVTAAPVPGQPNFAFGRPGNFPMGGPQAPGMPAMVGGFQPGFMRPPGPGGAPGFPGQQANFNGGFGGGGGQQANFNGGFGGFNGNFGLPALQRAELERQLRRQGNYAAIAQFRMNRQIPQTMPLEPLVVREYAHKHRPSADGFRRDFAETVCWQPVLVLPDGKGQVSFDLPDSVTRFDVVAWGYTADGRLGAVRGEFASRLPFSIEPKVPTEITHTDKVIIPVAVANNTATKRAVALEVKTTNLRLESAAKLNLQLGPEEGLRRLFTFRPSKTEGEATVRFEALCKPFSTDKVERSFKVVPEGFPFVGSKSDLLEGTAQQIVTLPAWIPGTLKLQAQAFPSTLADLQKGLEAMLREPSGCFEQTSSSNYPNVLILNYLKESDQSRPGVEKRARQLLERGYQKLVSFECRDPQQPKRRGYEWFGGTAPPHEALTAYGLLEFRDMARVQAVDPAMLERTRKYLLAQRDGRGGFKRNQRALDSFGRAPPDLTNAYIVWALVESGGKDKLDVELDALTKQAKDSRDPYFLALVGNSLVGRGRTKEGLNVLRRLAGLQKADGHLEGARTSITGSGGRDLEIETTSLATLAWLKANRPADFNGNVQKAARWIGRQRGGFGGFGSTQSTILALKALIAFTRENRKTAAAGELRLYVNDTPEPVAVKAFPAGTQETVVVSLPREDLLKPGKNTVRVEMTGKKNAFPYTLTWSYNTLKPANPEGCPVRLTAKLDRDRAVEGETVHLTATVENQSGKGQGMAVAILGLPGGLALPEDLKQLKDMARLRDNDTKPGLISHWEIRGRELVLYWRDLAPAQKIDVSVDLICRIPGEYRGPASRAYLYYNADRKFWAEPLGIAIQPARGE